MELSVPRPYRDEVALVIHCYKEYFPAQEKHTKNSFVENQQKFLQGVGKTRFRNRPVYKKCKLFREKTEINYLLPNREKQRNFEEIYPLCKASMQGFSGEKKG